MPPSTSLGRYRLIRRIARGGMGEVYLALLEAPGGVRRPVAVKVLDGQASLHAALFAEARLAALIAHPNVVQLFDAGVDGDLAWFVMEYVPGLTFTEVLDAGKGVVPPWLWARIVAEACAALHAVHEARDERGAPLHVVHRDVTPQNLLVSWDGFVKLIDFGIARSRLPSTHTTTGVVKGKVGYMSPEQASGAPLDRRSDVFALGVLLWEALAGRRLFQRGTEAETLASIVRGDVPSLREVAPDLPEELASIAARALLQSPGERFPTALEMQRALETALSRCGLVIGENEISHAVAAVAPERRAEHERWLENGSASVADPPHAVGLAAGSTKHVARAPGQRERSISRVVRWAVVLSLGSGSVVAGYLLSRSRGRAAHAGAELRAADAARTERGHAPSPKASVAALQEFYEKAAASASTLTRPKLAPSPVGTPSPARSAPDFATIGTGTLHVNARPTWATVRIDGQAVGSTPLVVPNLASGAHIVEVSAEGEGPPRRRSVVVEVNTVERLDFKLD